jgi:glycosyltransferase involved in cell wall biosynthesis
MKRKNKFLQNWQQFWDPITIYKNLRALYFAVIPKNSKAYERTPQFLRTFLKQMYLLNIYYQEWIRRYDTFNDQDLYAIESTIFDMPTKPPISIIMPVYDPPLKFLEEAIESVRRQMYPFWQLCIADDASTDPDVKRMIEYYVDKDDRIIALYRKTNGHISAASNSALTMVKNDYIALLDHDDIIHPLALYYVAETINTNPQCEIIYSDEDKITKWGRRFDPYFKPEFNYELLLSQNMISHFGVYKTDAIQKINGFREGLEGSQDYDLLLRILENIDPNQIKHIPRPLYHWRVSEKSVAENVSVKPYATKAGVQALEEHLARRSAQGRVKFLSSLAAYQVDYLLNEPNPSVTVIIVAQTLSKDYIHTIDEILSNTNYSNFDILLSLSSNEEEIVTNNLSHWQKKVQVIKRENHPEFSKINQFNQSIADAQSDYVVILCEPLIGYPADWLYTLVGQATQHGVGAVAPKLIYKNGFVYSTGVILLPDLSAKNLSEGTETDDIGYFGWAKLRRGYSVLSEKCLLIKKEIFELVGGFSADYHNLSFSSIDMCLQLRENGFRNILCPSVELCLQEDYINIKNNREVNKIDLSDKHLMQQNWQDWFENDPAFNPNLSVGDDGKILVNLTPKIKI